MLDSSQIGVINNAIENKKKLEFARNVLNDENFEKLYKSYRQLFWFQISYLIISSVILVLTSLIFREYWSEVLMIGAFILIFGFIIWLILSQFIAGKLWRKYDKWYRKGGNMEGLYKLFS